MRRKVFKKMDRDAAVAIRSDIDGLDEHPGYITMATYFQAQIADLRGKVKPITSDDFAALNSHNRKLHKAEALEEVLEWVQDAREQCDSVIEGDR